MTGSAKQSTLSFFVGHGLLRFTRNDRFSRLIGIDASAIIEA
jgi:hypothetical protein